MTICYVGYFRILANKKKNLVHADTKSHIYVIYTLITHKSKQENMKKRKNKETNGLYLQEGGERIEN